MLKDYLIIVCLIYTNNYQGVCRNKLEFIIRSLLDVVQVSGSENDLNVGNVSRIIILNFSG